MSLRTPSRRVTKRTRGIAPTRSVSARTKTELFALLLLPRALTLGLNLGPTTLTAAVQIKESAPTIATSVVFDERGSIMPLRLERPAQTIEKVLSRSEEAALKAAEEARRQAAARSVRTVAATATPEPDFGTKRALVQQIASQAGIDWKLLESVWQIESGKSWQTGVASSAGATGPMQFMPGTWLGYGGAGDITYAPDALRAGAKLLVANGAAAGQIDRALFAYNHATWYVEQVKAMMASM